MLEHQLDNDMDSNKSISNRYHSRVCYQIMTIVQSVWNTGYISTWYLAIITFEFLTTKYRKDKETVA